MAIVVFILFTLSACMSPTPKESPVPEEAPPIGSVAPAPGTLSGNEPTLNLLPIPLYEELNLSEDEDVIILDVCGSALLLNVYTDYPSADAHYREEGYSSKTVHLVLYDWNTQETLLTMPIPDDHYCADGFLWGENSFVYTSISLDPTLSYPQYDIIHYDGSENITIVSGICSMLGSADPHIVPLSDSHFAYSYFDPQTKFFGINVVSETGTITPQLTLLDDGATEHLSTDLVFHNGMYLYYAAVKEKGTFYVGTAEKIHASFSLPPTERVYQYHFLTDDLLLFTIERIGSDGASSTNVIVKDMLGNDLLTRRSDVLFRLEANGNGTAMGIDQSYNPYFLQVDPPHIQTYPIPEMSAKPVRFYAVDEASYLIHTYKSIYLKDESPSVILVSVETPDSSPATPLPSS